MELSIDNGGLFMKKVLHTISSERFLPAALLLFTLLTVVQCIILVPYMLLCTAGFGAKVTYASAGLPIATVMWIIAIPATIYLIKLVSKKAVLLFAVVSYAIVPLILQAIVLLQIKFLTAASLPYEWGKFPRFISEVYSGPAALLILLILLIQGIVYLSRRKS